MLRAWLALVFLVWLWQPGLAAPTSFIRVAKSSTGEPTSLQVAITRYQGPGYTVDLIGAIHVGEKSYYQTLNQAFKQYDVLLYELIAEPASVQARREAYERGEPSGFGAGEGTNPLAAFQSILKDTLGLDYQLERIEYGAPNFVHADMTPAEFADSWSQRGETVQGMLAKVFESGLDEPETQDIPALQELDIFSILLRGPTAREKILMRQVMAYTFEQPELAENMLGGAVIVGARNDKALQVLGQQIKAGKRHLGVFYGAAHMPDLERKMLQQFKLKKLSQRWLACWDLRLPARIPVPAE